MTNSRPPGWDTVLITGASGGIGEEFAKLFASKGCRLILVARSGEKLGSLAQTLRDQHQVAVETLAIDLAAAGAATRLGTFDVDVLVNNAGYGTFGPFAESDLEAELGQIQLNVTSLTHLTRLLLPGMIKRGRGGILNVASTAAFQPGPMMAVYYATKAYVLSFSEALANELQDTGIKVSCLCPGPTKTGFYERSKMGNGGLLSKKSVMMEASDVARRGYQGLVKGKRLVIPGLLNKMLAHSTRLGTRGMSAGVVRHIMDGIRASKSP
jgi:uncharacterized protein